MHKQDALVLKVTDHFLHIFLSRARDAAVKQLDPYRDATLDHSALVQWRAELSRVKVQIHDETVERLTQTRELPRDHTSREAILQSWVERALSVDEEFQALLDVE